MLLAGLGYGANMGFVSVLSSPVGSFSSLETASSSPVVVGDGTTSGKVNFCNTNSSSGTITLLGNAGAKLGTVDLSSNSGIAGNMQAFRANQFALRGDAWIEGKALVASQVNVGGIEIPAIHFLWFTTNPTIIFPAADEARVRVGQTLNATGGTIGVKGLSADKLYLMTASGGNNGQLTTSASVTGLQWSNMYNAFYDHQGAPTATPGTQTYGGNTTAHSLQHQYLLKGRKRLSHGVGLNAFLGIHEGQCFEGAAIRGVEEVEIGGFCPSDGPGGGKY